MPRDFLDFWRVPRTNKAEQKHKNIIYFKTMGRSLFFRRRQCLFRRLLQRSKETDHTYLAE